jgi:hypothetical protein
VLAAEQKLTRLLAPAAEPLEQAPSAVHHPQPVLTRHDSHELWAEHDALPALTPNTATQTTSHSHRIQQHSTAQWGNIQLVARAVGQKPAPNSASIHELVTGHHPQPEVVRHVVHDRRALQPAEVTAQNRQSEAKRKAKRSKR